jgi:UDPglucose--hexose-1-phosphate uridylyltransferase
MSQIRQDPTTKEWVIIASERSKRPNDFVQQQLRQELPDFSPSCPFCPGNEKMTPPESFALRDKNDRWRIRVFPNLFPALIPEGSTKKREEDNFFLYMGGIGVHEVIVETPRHNAFLALADDSRIADVLLTYQKRYIALSKTPFIKSIVIFKNYGPSAGTSLEHPHSQLVAIPIVPRHIRIRLEIAARYYNDTGRSLYSDIVDHELEVGKRVVTATDKFAVFHPFASHFPFETWIVPRTYEASFCNVSSNDLSSLAHILGLTLLKLYRGLNDPDFNLIIDTAPIGDENKDYYTWHIRIIPRLTDAGGFEIGSGIYINTALPEETAQFMREVKVEQRM